MTETAIAEKLLTLDEYIEFEQTSENKHEFRNGKLFEMAGGKLPHNLLAGKIFNLLTNMLGACKKNCTVVNSDQKIYIPKNNRGLFGDVTVFCGSPTFQDNQSYLLTNPVLVVEVLSESTQSYDKGDKFDLYRSLPSFREYMLVSQNEPDIQVRYLTDPESDLWQYSNVSDLNKSVKLQSIGIEVKMKDVYAAVEKIS